jgi:hypothetical protein
MKTRQVTFLNIVAYIILHICTKRSLKFARRRRPGAAPPTDSNNNQDTLLVIDPGLDLQFPHNIFSRTDNFNEITHRNSSETADHSFNPRFVFGLSFFAARLR